MKLFGLVLVLCFSMASFAECLDCAVKTKVVTELDASEPFEGMAFHDGYLYVGKSRKGLSSDYALEVYDSSGKLVSTKPFGHSLRYIYPYDKDTVIVVGVSATPNLTRYTIVKRQGSDFVLGLKNIPETGWADQWAGRPGEMYFTDPGGKPGEIVDSPDDMGPLQTVFRLASAPHWLKPRIPGPRRPTLVGKSLYVIENPTIGSGGKDVVRIDLTNESHSKLFNEKRANLTQMAEMKKAGLLAIAETDASQVLLVDLKTNKLAATAYVPGGRPIAVAELGKCLVVASEQSKRIGFYNLAGKMLVEWDVSGVGEKLRGIRAMSVDEKTGRVYVRSNYACNPMIEACGADRNSVVMAESENKEGLKQCY